MNWVDLVVLVAVAVSAVRGLKLGATIQVLSYGGFLLGFFLGALLTPSVAGLFHSHLSQQLAAMVMVFGLAGLLGGAGRLLGGRSSAALDRARLGAVDSGLGVVVAVVATLLVAWLLSSLLANSQSTTLSAGINKSTIVRAMDGVLPNTPSTFNRIEGFLRAKGLSPEVFNGLGPSTAGPVALPTSTSPQVQAAVRTAGASTVKIVGEGCGVIQEGSGFVVAPGLVVTNAHVVAGILHPQVEDLTGTHDTETVSFDPELDLAVLRVPGLSDPPLHLDDGALLPRGTTGAVLGYPGGGNFTSDAAGVELGINATGLDIYSQHNTTREIYELTAVVRPGNSGGPLVYESANPSDPLDGTVFGVVFARSTYDPNVGYALASGPVLAEVRTAQQSQGSVSDGGCVG
jgi:S1-C subfamily serine protease